MYVVVFPPPPALHHFAVIAAAGKVSRTLGPVSYFNFTRLALTQRRRQNSTFAGDTHARSRTTEHDGGRAARRHNLEPGRRRRRSARAGCSTKSGPPRVVETTTNIDRAAARVSRALYKSASENTHALATSSSGGIPLGVPHLR